MIRKLLVFLIAAILHGGLSAQNITGKLSLLSNQPITLEGFNGMKTYPISSTTIDDEGNFQLNYTATDYGVGYLMSADNKAFFVILSGENIEIKGEALSYTETIEVVKGQQNKLFEQYSKEHPRREQALSAWLYLEKIYMLDSLFLVQQTPKQAIQKEKKRIKEEDAVFLSSLPEESYVSWFLPLRKLISSVSVVAQYRTEDLPATIAALRSLDYSDKRLYKSGLLKDAIDSHIWLLENSGPSLDSVYVALQISIDAMIDKLVKDEEKLIETSEYLFNLLEERSLFQASEYLALKLLNEQACTINNDFAAKLESYRAMKKGNTAPDIDFLGDVFAPAYPSGNIPAKLSDLKSKYTVVVFGSSWCPACPQELSHIASLYDKWKRYGVEVVFISLDEDKQIFKNFAGIFPFISTCDLGKWESPAVTDYHVFATPTIYLLDNKREIILRPHSVNQLNSWVDWYLVQENK